MQAQEVLDGTSDDVLAELIALNGSSAGARPKALIGVNDKRDHIIHGVHDLPAGYTPWMVKFPNSQDGLDAGAIEYVYALMAKEAGVSMPDVHLFPAKRGTGYFAIKRFDRDGDKRYHMHTACGLLHSDFRTPSLDYEDLVALTGMLTRDVREVEKLYQLAVFLVLAVFGNATMWMAVFADMGASLLVVFNGLRLLRTNSLLHETESGPSTKTL